MNTFPLLMSIMTATSDADFLSMQNQFQSLLGFNGTLRALPINFVTGLQEYGCWCYFEDLHGMGRGQPLTEIDEQCKILHDGYECAILDHSDPSSECEPWSVTYRSATGLGGSGIDEECYEVNPSDQCAARACIIEGRFVVSILNLFLTGHTIESHLKVQGGFIRDGTCIGRPGKRSPKACCGDYPVRFPFKLDSGKRACCGQTTYSTEALVCCDDGHPRMTCN